MFSASLRTTKTGSEINTCSKSSELDFPTIRANFGVKYNKNTPNKNKYYYEVKLNYTGLMQIGVCTNKMMFSDENFGDGVGDDNSGWAVDLERLKKWFNGSQPYGNRKWKKGDCVGVGLDLDNRCVDFWLNGKTIEDKPAFTDIKIDIDDDTNDTIFFPAMSLSHGAEKEGINVTILSKNFEYRIPNGYQTFAIPFDISSNTILHDYDKMEEKNLNILSKASYHYQENEHDVKYENVLICAADMSNYDALNAILSSGICINSLNEALKTCCDTKNGYDENNPTKCANFQCIQLLFSQLASDDDSRSQCRRRLQENNKSAMVSQLFDKDKSSNDKAIDVE